MVQGTNISSHQLVGSDQNHQIIVVNHQAIKLFIYDIGYQGGGHRAPPLDLVLGSSYCNVYNTAIDSALFAT